MKSAGREIALGKGVEFTDVDNLEAEDRRMPLVVLHELAHGYHDKTLVKGYRNPDVAAAYQAAKAAGSYDKVARWTGKAFTKEPEKAYAMSNPMEYFSETTEAYFGRNDFYPFNREELQKHDPVMFDVLEKAWLVR